MSVPGQGFVIEDNQPSGELAHNTLQLLLGLAVDDATVVLIEENNYVGELAVRRPGAHRHSAAPDRARRVVAMHAGLSGDGVTVNSYS
eukprot:scaffold7215_cov366-Prasinococcus_capsulatus_cf.AAC.15